MTNKAFKRLRDDLWLAANKLRAGSDLKSNDYSTPVLGIIFLKFADIKYSQHEAEIKTAYEKAKGTRLEEPLEKIAIERCGLYIPDTARYDYLKDLSADKAIDKAVIQAMKDIEKYVTPLKDTLPKDEFYAISRKGQTLLKQLLKIFSTIPDDSSGDLLGKIYEFFVGKFGLEEAQKGGEFFTPTSVVNLMVEYIEPYHGKIFDPACGSGGMFVQSNNFIKRHHRQRGSVSPISVYGQEKTLQTVNLAKMNLAINGLRGEVKQGDSYAEDLFGSYGKFDFVMANPPFNVKEVNEDTVKKDKRFTEYGLPGSKSKTKAGGVTNIPNANYLWISLFATSLKPGGRAALVMANSASDAGHSEYDIRKTLIQKGLISAMLTLPGNMFSTVTLPATLWFFAAPTARPLSRPSPDGGKATNTQPLLFDESANEVESLQSGPGADGSFPVGEGRDGAAKGRSEAPTPSPRGEGRGEAAVWFVDTRNVYHQVDRAHREFTEEQIQNLAAIHHLRAGNRKAFIQTVQSHYNAAAEGLPELKAHLIAANAALQKQVAGLTAWAKNLDDEAQVAARESEGFLEKLEAVEELDALPIEDAIQAMFEAISEDAKADMKELLDEMNRRQHNTLRKAETLLHDHHQLKKEVEKNYRDYEKLYTWADAHLRTKEDPRWKVLAKPKEVRWLLDTLNEWSNTHKNNSYEDCEAGLLYFLKAAEWLQQRFPAARYEDVTGLCKLATMADIEEQDYSLNPGRYVGVVIEEDGLTEEEFEKEILELNHELQLLCASAESLNIEIAKTMEKIFECE